MGCELLPFVPYDVLALEDRLVADYADPAVGLGFGMDGPRHDRGGLGAAGSGLVEVSWLDCWHGRSPLVNPKPGFTGLGLVQHAFLGLVLALKHSIGVKQHGGD